MVNILQFLILFISSAFAVQFPLQLSRQTFAKIRRVDGASGPGGCQFVSGAPALEIPPGFEITSQYKYDCAAGITVVDGSVSYPNKCLSIKAEFNDQKRIIDMKYMAIGCWGATIAVKISMNANDGSIFILDQPIKIMT